MDGDKAGLIEVTWGRAVKVWWAFLWRLVVLAALPSVVVASVMGGLVAFLFVPRFASFVWWMFFLGGTVVLAIPVVRWVLTVAILDGVAVRLVLAEDPPNEQPPAP